MIEKIECSIDASLNDIFSDFQFPDFIKLSFLRSNESYSKENNYSVLVLNDKNFPLNSNKRFRSEESFDVIAYYRSSDNNQGDIVDACKVLLEICNAPGVLSFEQIEALTKIGILIYNVNCKNIQYASYDLNLHNEYLKSGVSMEKSDTISIEPFGYVVVGAKEYANLPTNICANYDVKVHMFCRGIMLSNGPQIDPGYRGALLALLFNASSKQFDMEQYKGYEFATIQFFTLSSPSKKRYSGNNLLKISLGQYIRQYADEAMSKKVATIITLKDATDSLGNKVKKIDTRIGVQDTKLASHDTSIANLEGKHTKWMIIVTCIIGLTAILYAAIATFSDNSKIYDLGVYIGTSQEKINSANNMIHDLELRTKKLKEDQYTYKSKVQNLQKQLEIIDLKFKKKVSENGTVEKKGSSYTDVS